MGKKKSLVEERLEEAEGMFVTADNVEEGDEFEILDVTLDRKTFETPYINCLVKDATGEEATVRLGVQNLRRITEKLGTDEREWVGCKLVVLGTQFYKGLKQTGILWTGKKA